MGGHMGHEQKRAGCRKIIRKVMLEHPGAVETEGLAELAVGDDLLIQRRVIEAAGADRCHDKTELQAFGHILFAACALPVKNRSIRRTPTPAAFQWTILHA